MSQFVQLKEEEESCHSGMTDLESLEGREEEEHGRILYRASFEEQCELYVSYMTWLCFFISLAMIIMYGLGLLLLLYIPVARYIARRDIQTRRLYITAENVVYKTRPPSACPCLGFNKTEKHILLPLITDVVLSQSWFQAWFGLWTVTIENAGQGGGPNKSADLRVEGISEPELFKKILLRAATAKRAGLQFTSDDVRSVIEQHPAVYAMHSAQHPVMMGVAHGTPTGLQPASADVQQMSETLLRMERLISEQTRLLAAVAANSAQNAASCPVTTTTTTNDS